MASKSSIIVRIPTNPGAAALRTRLAHLQVAVEVSLIAIEVAKDDAEAIEAVRSVFTPAPT